MHCTSSVRRAVARAIKRAGLGPRWLGCRRAGGGDRGGADAAQHVELLVDGCCPGAPERQVLAVALDVVDGGRPGVDALIGAPSTHEPLVRQRGELRVALLPKTTGPGRARSR